MKISFCFRLYCMILLGLALSPVVAAGATLSDWTLEEILEKVAEANGGDDGIGALTNVRIRGEVDTGNSSYDFLLLKKRPGKTRMRIMFRGSSNETVFDGVNGWHRITRGSSREVTDLTGKRLESIRLDSDFDGPLIGEPLEGVTISLEKIERIGRVDYFVVREENPLRVAHHYLDSRTFRELKVVTEYSNEDGDTQEVVNFYYDYERHGTIWVAHRIVRVFPDSRKETVTILEVELNPGILDLVFDKPEKSD